MPTSKPPSITSIPLEHRLIPAGSGYQITNAIAINDNGQIVAADGGLALLLTPTDLGNSTSALPFTSLRGRRRLRSPGGVLISQHNARAAD